MRDICLTCHMDPGSHSFSKLCDINNVSVFYTNPSEATKYNDNDGIMVHFQGMMSKHVNDKWGWIIDASGFQTHHMMELQLTRNLIELINNNYISNLEYIKVKNTNVVVRRLFNVFLPVIGSDLAKKVTFE